MDVDFLVPGGALTGSLFASLARQTSVELPHLEPDTTLGDYRIIRSLAKGSSSRVYLAASQQDVEQLFAIKVTSAQNPSLRFFIREQLFLQQLQHPNIVKSCGSGASPEYHWIAMEYIAGQRIDHYCDSHHLSLHERVNLFKQLCEAVTTTHESSILHGDIKPANVLIDQNGRVKLIDFGIARNDTQSATGDLPKEYTPNCASPEQLLGKTITKYADIWQLGTLLDRLSSTLLKQQSPAGSPQRNLKKRIQSAIAIATAAVPTNRFQDVNELRQAC